MRAREIQLRNPRIKREYDDTLGAHDLLPAELTTPGSPITLVA
jgi:hypothetical protein